MGFLSKAWKGVKKGFKSIGKGIKSAFKKFGKFMNKIGVFGQIAMMFILPGVGQALMSGLGNAFGAVVGQTAAQATAATAAASTSAAAAAAGTATATAVGTGTATAAQAATIEAGKVAAGELAKGVATKTLTKTVVDGVTTYAGRAGGMLGSKSAIISGAGKVLQAASNFVKVGANAFSTVTEGITSFVGEFGKTALNKIPGVNIEGAAGTFGGAWDNVQANVMNNATKTMASFNKAIGYTPPPVAVTSVPAGGATASLNPAEAVGNNSVAIETKVDLTKESQSLMAKRPPTETLKTVVPTDPQFEPNYGPQQGKKSLMDKTRDFYDNTKEQMIEGYEDFKDDPIGTVFGENPIGKTVDRASGQLTGALTDRLVQGKREAGNVYSTNVQGMSAAFDMPQVGTSPEVQQRTQELGYNPAAFKANYSWGAGAQNPEYMQSMGFDRFATVRGIG